MKLRGHGDCVWPCTIDNANSVIAFEGRYFGFGRCCRCAVVLKREGGGWRLLSPAEWAAAPKDLDLARPWARLHWWDDRHQAAPPQ